MLPFVPMIARQICGNTFIFRREKVGWEYTRQASAELIDFPARMVAAVRFALRQTTCASSTEAMSRE